MLRKDKGKINPCVCSVYVSVGMGDKNNYVFKCVYFDIKLSFIKYHLRNSIAVVNPNQKERKSI